MFKKIILAALIVTSAAFADFFSVGARAAANFGTAWGDDADDATWGVGFNAGVALKIDILPVITIIPGLEVDYRRLGEETSFSDGFSEIENDTPCCIVRIITPCRTEVSRRTGANAKEIGKGSTCHYKSSEKNFLKHIYISLFICFYRI